MNSKSPKDWMDEEDDQYDKMINVFIMTMMERFANYRTRDIQVAIHTFRSKIKDKVDKGKDIDPKKLLDEFDEQFNITTQRQGYTNDKSPGN